MGTQKQPEPVAQEWPKCFLRRKSLHPDHTHSEVGSSCVASVFLQRQEASPQARARESVSTHGVVVQKRMGADWVVQMPTAGGRGGGADRSGFKFSHCSWNGTELSVPQAPLSSKQS